MGAANPQSQSRYPLEMSICSQPIYRPHPAPKHNPKHLLHPTLTHRQRRQSILEPHGHSSPLLVREPIPSRQPDRHRRELPTKRPLRSKLLPRQPSLQCQKRRTPLQTLRAEPHRPCRWPPVRHLSSKPKCAPHARQILLGEVLNLRRHPGLPRPARLLQQPRRAPNDPQHAVALRLLRALANRPAQPLPSSRFPPI